MATPQAERASGSKAVLGKRLTEAFESVPVAKKSRLSVASAVQNDDSPADEGDGTGSLLNADDVSKARIGKTYWHLAAKCSATAIYYSSLKENTHAF